MISGHFIFLAIICDYHQTAQVTHTPILGAVFTGEAAASVDDHARAARDQTRGRGAIQKLGHHHRYAACAHDIEFSQLISLYEHLCNVVLSYEPISVSLYVYK